MLKKYTTFFDSNIYLNAAEALGYTTSVLHYEKSFAEISNGNKKLYIYENWLSINDQVAFAFARDKYVSGEILSSVVPNLFPKTIQIDAKDDSGVSKLVEFAKKQSFSVVIKPNDQSLGRGVFILPKNEDEVREIAIDSLKKYSSILGQKYVSADDEYRIIYVNGEFFDAVKRIAAYVIGDGVTTIDDLINQKNEKKRKYDFPLIEIDSSTDEILNKNGLQLSTVVEKDQRVALKNTRSFSQGGETERIQKKDFHPKYIKAFDLITKTSRLNFIGIDLMASNISDEPNPQDAVNEINSGPMANLHYSADLKEGKFLDSAKKLLKIILE